MSAPFTKEGPAPLATYVVAQKGSIGGAVGGNLSKATAAGNTLIVYVISNSSTQPTVTYTGGGGGTMTCGYWSQGHGSNWSGIFYVLNTPAGITAYATSGIYGSGYREVSGIVSNPIVVWNFGGNSTAGTTFTVPVPGATSVGDFLTGMVDYSAANGSTPYADGWTDGAIVTTFGQESYTTGTTAGSGTMASSIYDTCSLTFKQTNNVGVGGVNWTAVGSPASRNVTSGQGTWSINVAAAGDLLVIYTKTAASLTWVNGISGAGSSAWVQALTAFTDNNGTPHIQQCWIARASAGFTGAQTVTITYNTAVGTTGVETVFQEFNAGSGLFQFTVDGTANRNNGSAAYVTWPANAPTGGASDLLLGFARVVSGGPFRNPSGPAVIYTTVATDIFLYALNMQASFQPQVWDNVAALSHCSSLLIKATPLTIDGISDSTSLDAGSGTLGLSGAVVGFSGADTLDGNGSLTQTMVIAASSATASAGSGSISARGVIAGSALADTLDANGTVALRIVIAGSSATSSSASGSITALGAITGSSATGSAASGAVVTIGGINGKSATSSAGSGTIAGITSIITGSSSTSSAGSGALATVYGIAGTSSTASSANGTVGRSSPVAGSSATASIASGSIVQTMAIAGNSATATAASGAIGRYTPVAGMSATVSSASGSITQICAVAGTSFTASSGTGNAGGAPPPAAGNSVTQTSASGTLAQICVVSGSAVTVSSATGSMGGAVPLAGSSTTGTAASGTITAILSLAGSSATASSGTGSAGGAAPMAGFSATGSAAAGTVTALLALAGSSQTASSGQGTLSGAAVLSGLSATATAAYGTVYEVGELDGLSATGSAGYGTLAIAGVLSGLSATASAGYGTLLPPFVAGLLPPKVSAIVTVRPGPSAAVSVKQAESAITVRKAGAVLAVSGVSSTVSVIRTTAKVN